jgi:glycogen operon protein
MIEFRKRHPSLSRSRFWRYDVRWYGVQHAPDLSFDSHGLAFCLHGASLGDIDIYVMINAWSNDLKFGIHEGQPGQWRRVVDTSLSSPGDIVQDENATSVPSAYYRVAARSVVVLVRPD